MLSFPHPGCGLITQNGSGRASSTFGTNVISGGTAHTLGSSFTEIFSSTTHDTYLVKIMFNNTLASNTDTDTLVNVYIGASSAETLLVPNLLAGWSNSQTSLDIMPKCYQFPLFIPAGSRISAKSQSVQTSKNVYTWIKLEGGGLPPHWCGRAVETLGADTATSGGTSVTPGTTAEGSFTSIGTTGFEYGYILPFIGGNISDTTLVANVLGLDIGSGGAVYRNLQDWWFGTNADERAGPTNSGGRGAFVTIPASTSLQVRLQSSGTDTEPKDVCLYGVY